MPQTLAMEAKYFPIDFNGIAQQGQQYRANEMKMQNMPLQNQLERMQIGDEMDKRNTLRDYRDAAAEDGPIDALDTLDSYPDVQADIYKQLDGMDIGQKKAAAQRAEVFTRAAQYVLSFPEGSPQRQQAWDSSLEALKQDGYLDELQYQQYKSVKPSALILNQTLSNAEMIKAYIGPKADESRARIDLTRAREGAVNAGVERSDTESRARIERGDRRTDALNEQGDARVGIMRDKASGKTTVKATGGNGNKAEAAALRRVDNLAGNAGIDYGTPEYEDLKKKVFTEMGIGQDAAAPPAATGAGTQDDPARPTTRAEAEALPSGTYFLTPDGKLIRKK